MQVQSFLYAWKSEGWQSQSQRQRRRRQTWASYLQGGLLCQLHLLWPKYRAACASISAAWQPATWRVQLLTAERLMIALLRRWQLATLICWLGRYQAYCCACHPAIAMTATLLSRPEHAGCSALR